MRTAELLARAIRVVTVNPPGNEAPLAQLWVEELTAAGIEAKVVSLGGSEGGTARSAVWAKVPGTGGGLHPVVLLSHLDVVPANPDEWSVDPFAGEIRDGRVFGRGALDAKGVAAVHAVALMQLAARPEEARLPRDVILLATPDEETGGRHGAGWLAKERPDLLGRAEFLLTEGGSISVQGGARPAVWGVTITEKSPCWLELRTRARGGHSSAPSADDAVPRLVSALDRVRRIESEIDVLPEVAQMFRATAPLAPAEDRPGYRELAASLSESSAFKRRFLGNPGRNALVRNTISITVLEGGSRTNVAPGEASAQLDVRLLPGESCEQFRDALVEVIDDRGVEVGIILSFPSRSSSANTRLFRAIERVAAQTDPGALVIPRMIGGFTDAHWFRELGIVSYGFVPRRLSTEDTRGVHGIDESVSVENLAYGVATLLAILDELDTE